MPRVGNEGTHCMQRARAVEDRLHISNAVQLRLGTSQRVHDRSAHVTRLKDDFRCAVGGRDWKVSDRGNVQRGK